MLYLIKDNRNGVKKGMYWCANESGYTDNITKAGIYDEEAKDKIITRQGNLVRTIEITTDVIDEMRNKIKYMELEQEKEETKAKRIYERAMHEINGERQKIEKFKHVLEFIETTFVKEVEGYDESSD